MTIAYKLGELTGELMAAFCETKTLRFDDKDEDNKRAMSFIEKDVTLAMTLLIQEILPELPKKIISEDLEEFYNGLVRVLVITRTPLSKTLGILPELPGNPDIRETWKFSSEETVFHDKFTRQYLKAENEEGAQIIRTMISQISQISQHKNSHRPQQDKK